MDESLSARWKTALVGLRDQRLASLPLLADGSAHPETLAWRTVLREVLPGRVTAVRTAGAELCRIELGTSQFAFSRLPVDVRAEPILAALHAGDRILSMDDMADGAIWFVLRDGEELPNPLDFHFRHLLQGRVEAEIERRRRLLDSSLARSGWRVPRIPLPDGLPDDRIRLVSRWSGDGGLVGSSPLTARDLVDDIARSTRTLVVVPDAVEAAVQMARLLYVRGWHQWEFFTLADREGYIGLEASLRLLDAEERGQLDQRASFNALLKRVGVRDWPPLMSDWERQLGQSMRASRNALVHPSMRQTVEWISWARQSLESVVGLINLMWARRVASVPAELAWEVEKRP